MIAITLSSLFAGILLPVALVSVNFAAFAIVTFALIGLIANYFDDPSDKSYEFNKRFIQVMTMLPSFGTKFGPIFLVYGMFRNAF